MKERHRHSMAFTYEPKIPAVISGDCRQTIRKTKVHEGDLIHGHGWADKPYRSLWSWRMDVTVKKVLEIEVLGDEGFLYNNLLHPWDSEFANELARLDYIDPPTGLGLKAVLRDKNKGDEDGGIGTFYVIRW